MSKATWVSYQTIKRGLKEIQDGAFKDGSPQGIRQEGGGRKKIKNLDPVLMGALRILGESSTSADPQAPILWTSKSLRTLTKELQEQGFKVSYPTVGTLLEDLGYSLGNRKSFEGSSHPDQEAQFKFLNCRVKAFFRMNQSVIYVDCKKQELIDNLKNSIKQYHKKGQYPNKCGIKLEQN